MSRGKEARIGECCVPVILVPDQLMDGYCEGQVAGLLKKAGL
jgi:hypothetical protein